jgi:hypothetical protein
VIDGNITGCSYYSADAVAGTRFPYVDDDAMLIAGRCDAAAAAAAAAAAVTRQRTGEN